MTRIFFLLIWLFLSHLNASGQSFSISSDSTYLNLKTGENVQLPTWVLLCDKITSVDLSGCGNLYNAINEISKMPNVLTIAIQNSSVKKLPYNIYKVKNLKTLNLQDNKLSVLPVSIKFCDSLKNIDLSGNTMSEYGVEDIIKHVSKLRWLSISNNNLSSLPLSICTANELSFLFISDNVINNLPECIYSMKSLTQLGIFSKRTDSEKPLRRNSIDLKEVKEKFSKNGLAPRLE